MNITHDKLITKIMNGIEFRFMDRKTPGTMNSTTDPQENLRALDLANTNFSGARSPLMQMEFLRTPRMSTIAIAHIINSLVKQMPAEHSYVNIGVWCGWSFFAGIIGNEDKHCVGIDNFSEFPEMDSKKIFEYQYNILKTKNSEFYEMDYEDYFKDAHTGKIGVYFYDGDHQYEHQLRALEIANPFLADEAHVIVDDTNKHTAYNACRDFITQQKGRFKIVFDQKTANNSHPTFWNGLTILKKS